MKVYVVILLWGGLFQEVNVYGTKDDARQKFFEHIKKDNPLLEDIILEMIWEEGHLEEGNVSIQWSETTLEG